MLVPHTSTPKEYYNSNPSLIPCSPFSPSPSASLLPPPSLPVAAILQSPHACNVDAPPHSIANPAAAELSRWWLRPVSTRGPSTGNLRSAPSSGTWQRCGWRHHELNVGNGWKWLGGCLVFIACRLWESGSDDLPDPEDPKASQAGN